MNQEEETVYEIALAVRFVNPIDGTMADFRHALIDRIMAGGGIGMRNHRGGVEVEAISSECFNRPKCAGQIWVFPKGIVAEK